jgi:hypothetical protein
MHFRRLRIAFVLVGCLALLALVGCASASHNQVRSAAQLLSSYEFDPDSPLNSRIEAAPAFVIEYLNHYDKVDYYVKYRPTERELSLAQQNLLLLPKRYQTILQSRLVGICLIKDFIGSAFTELVFDQADKPYAFIAVNSATLSTPISDWVTRRDLSCFKMDSSGTIASTDCGTGYTGFMYAMLHETSHVVDFVLHYHSKAKAGDEKDFPFIGEYWKGFNQPLAQFDFLHRKDLSFYGLNGGPRLSITDAPRVYSELAKTPFASLYGSQTILEDFAELFAWTYYTQALHQRYAITVTQAGNTFTYAPMDNPLLRKRSSALLEVLQIDANGT